MATLLSRLTAILGQAMPRMRVDLPAIRANRTPWKRSRLRFKKIKKIGQGSFGEAFSAILGRQKVIVKRAFGAPGAISMHEAFQALRSEMMVLKRLQRFPFVPRLIEVGPDYFVQEDVGGEAMIRILARQGMEAREILSAVIATGTIISLIHKDGVAHRDLEPRNILLTPHGVVVIDFGIAVQKEDNEDAWREGIKKDVQSLIDVVALAGTARDLPTQAKMVLRNGLDKFRAKLAAGEYDENTARDLAHELLFVTAQLGARHARDKKLKMERIKVLVV